MFFLLFINIGMKKLVVWLALVFGLTLFAGCGNQTSTPDIEEEVAVVGEEMSEETFESTMEDLYKKWGKMTCSMTTNEDGVVMNGTLYMDGKKMRSDVKGAIEGMNIEMSTIIKDGYSYTRSSMSNEGWKVVYNEDEEEIDEDMNDVTDIDSPIKFSCKKGVSGADFDLPKHVEFKEMNY